MTACLRLASNERDSPNKSDSACGTTSASTAAGSAASGVNFAPKTRFKAGSSVSVKTFVSAATAAGQYATVPSGSAAARAGFTQPSADTVPQTSPDARSASPLAASPNTSGTTHAAATVSNKRLASGVTGPAAFKASATRSGNTAPKRVKRADVTGTNAVS